MVDARRIARRYAHDRRSRAVHSDCELAVLIARDEHAPRTTAHITVLDELAARVWIDVQRDPLTTIRTADLDLVVHFALVSRSGE